MAVLALYKSHLETCPRFIPTPVHARISSLPTFNIQQSAPFPYLTGRKAFPPPHTKVYICLIHSSFCCQGNDKPMPVKVLTAWESQGCKGPLRYLNLVQPISHALSPITKFLAGKWFCLDSCHPKNCCKLTPTCPATCLHTCTRRVHCVMDYVHK